MTRPGPRAAADTEEEFAVFSDKSYPPEDPAEPHRRRAKIMTAVNERGDMTMLGAADIDHAIEAEKTALPRAEALTGPPSLAGGASPGISEIIHWRCQHPC